MLITPSQKEKTFDSYLAKILSIQQLGDESQESREQLGNSTGIPVGIAPATRTRPVMYPYPQPHGFTRQKEPKNVQIGP